MIVPASIVEIICALALVWGAVAVLRQSPKAWRAALLGNLVAILGVAIGMVSLAVGAVREPQVMTFTTESCWPWRLPRSWSSSCPRDARRCYGIDLQPTWWAFSYPTTAV